MLALALPLLRARCEGSLELPKCFGPRFLIGKSLLETSKFINYIITTIAVHPLKRERETSSTFKDSTMFLAICS